MATKEEKKICFVISPIGEEGSETRERSDQVLKHIITGPVEQLGYTVVRADKISEPGIITTQIIEHIVDADLVIADLTEKNPNVFYELAIRHAIRKPLVQMIKKGEIIPFDVAATRIIQFDLQNLDSVASAKEEISSQVQSLEAGNSEVHNPISVSLDLKVLKESGNIEERSLADIVEAVSNLRLAVTALDKGSTSTKAIEELKSIIEDLPSRVERRIEPNIRRRKSKFHPVLLDDLSRIGLKSAENYLGFLMMVSLYKDTLPWIYELGIETYKGLKSTKAKVEKRNLIETFIQVLELADHPIAREMYGRSEDMHMWDSEIRHYLYRYMERLLNEDIPKS